MHRLPQGVIDAEEKRAAMGEYTVIRKETVALLLKAESNMRGLSTLLDVQDPRHPLRSTGKDFASYAVGLWSICQRMDNTFAVAEQWDKEARNE